MYKRKALQTRGVVQYIYWIIVSVVLFVSGEYVHDYFLYHVIVSSIFLVLVLINIALNIDYFFSPMHNENNIKPIIFYGLVTIVLFAGIYTSGGLVMNSESPTIIHDSLSSLYFSVVCWTTLGFGDFVPVPKVRLFAALEALLGYLSVGMLVAVVLRYIAANKVL